MEKKLGGVDTEFWIEIILGLEVVSANASWVGGLFEGEYPPREEFSHPFSISWYDLTSVKDSTSIASGSDSAGDSSISPINGNARKGLPTVPDGYWVEW